MIKRKIQKKPEEKRFYIQKTEDKKFLETDLRK